MGKVMMSGIVPPLTAPSKTITLAQLPAGSLVRLTEGGVATNFIIGGHNYESGLNGNGRTVLVRKDIYDIRAWDADMVNVYAESDIDSWLNNDYKALLNNEVQDAIATTNLYCTVGNKNNTVSTLERSVFLLSVTELGKTSSNVNIEGTKLSAASKLAIAYLNGVATNQWTRSSMLNSATTVVGLTERGNAYAAGAAGTSFGSRPAFTLPDTLMVNPEPNADGSVNLIL